MKNIIAQLIDKYHVKMSEGIHLSVIASYKTQLDAIATEYNLELIDWCWKINCLGFI